VLVALVASVVALTVVGGVIAATILLGGGAHGHRLKSAYVAYDASRPAPTSFGSISLAAVELDGAPDDGQRRSPADSLQVRVSVTLANERDDSVEYARPEDFRVVSASGREADRLPSLFGPPSALSAHSSRTTDLRFLAPRDGGLLWLEYRDPRGTWPLRIPLGLSGGSR
jgi:hypothetical protein